MKWTLLAVFVGLIAWSVVAHRIVPDTSSDDRTVLTWVSGDNPARRGTIDLFEQRNPDVKVLLDVNNSGVEKIIVQAKGGIGPDVFNIYTWYHLMDFVRTGALLPLDDYVCTAELRARDDCADRYDFGPDRTFAEVLDEISVEQFDPASDRYERTQYTVPANVNANVIFFHKSLFDEIGEPYPSGDWTWDECLATARKLVKRDESGRVVRYGIGTFEVLETAELVWQFGGELFDRTLTYCTLDSPEAIEAITFLHRMIVEEEVMPSVAARDSIGTAGGWGGSLTNLFANRQIGMIRIGRWALTSLRTFDHLRGDLGAVHLPYKREKTGIVRAMTVGINPQSPNREAALRFLEFLASEEFSRQVVESADALPPSPVVAAHADFIHDPTHPEEDFNHLFGEAIRRGRPLMMPPFIQGMRVQKIIDRYLALMSAGAMGPERMCRRMTAEINDAIRLNLTRYESMRAEYERRTGRPFDPDDFPPREAQP